MQSLIADIRARLRNELVSPVAIGEAVRNDLAARGLSQPGGLYVQGVEDRTLAAMDKIYEISFAALQEHCALNNSLASQFAPELLAYIEETLETLARSTVADLGGPNSSSAHAIASKARQLARLAKDQLGAA